MKPLVKIKNIGTGSCLSFRYDSKEYKIQATRDQQSNESTKSAVKGDYRFYVRDQKKPLSKKSPFYLLPTIKS